MISSGNFGTAAGAAKPDISDRGFGLQNNQCVMQVVFAWTKCPVQGTSRQMHRASKWGIRQGYRYAHEQGIFPSVWTYPGVWWKKFGVSGQRDQLVGRNLWSWKSHEEASDDPPRKRCGFRIKGGSSLGPLGSLAYLPLQHRMCALPLWEPGQQVIVK